MKPSTNVAAAMFASFAVALSCGCNRRSDHVAPAQQAQSPTDEVVTTSRAPAVSPGYSASPAKLKPRTMYATWYDVPANSIAARRAAPGEFTAAHDRYPLGTRLRVTHAANGRSVVVRVTDRGVPRGKAPLDLCKQAASELDMLREGTAKVRVEVLPEEEVAGAAALDSGGAAAQP